MSPTRKKTKYDALDDLHNKNSKWSVNKTHLVDTDDIDVYNDSAILENNKAAFKKSQATYFDSELKKIVLTTNYKLDPARQYIKSLRTINNSGDIVVDIRYNINDVVFFQYYTYDQDENIFNQYIVFRQLREANIQVHNDPQFASLRTEEFMKSERVFFMTRRILHIWIDSDCPTVAEHLTGFTRTVNHSPGHGIDNLILLGKNCKICKVINKIYVLHQRNIIDTMMTIKNLMITNAQTSTYYNSRYNENQNDDI